MPKRALITGLTGQDGSYLAELLLSKGYEVHGLRRRSSSFNTERVDHLITDFRHDADAKLFLAYADLADASSLSRLLYRLQPDEIYNLGAQSHVHVSFEIPEYTADITGVGVVRILEAAREAGVKARIYQASSSEMFGSTPPPQSERSPFHPRSPYGCAKVFAHHIAINYRESYGMHVSTGILFNHESPRRGENFVTRKITRAVARIRRGLQDKLYLGNLDARRDWGYAPEYVDAMWRILQQPEPDDYVIATGVAHTVRDFAAAAFAHVGLDWREFVAIDPRYYRPAEVDDLVGNATKAREQLGWSPTVGFEELVRIMVDADIVLLDERLRRGEEFTLSQAEAVAKTAREA
jgi:GDPmannose 4,6-dehydratase